MDDNNNSPVLPIGSTPPESTPPEPTPTPELTPIEPTPMLPTEPVSNGRKSKKGLVILITVILVVLIGSAVAAVLFLSSKSEPAPDPQPTPTPVAEKKDRLSNLKETVGVTVVPTLLDEIKEDSAWCGTFQLVWNDMKNEVVKQDIVFADGQPAIVDNLNKETFTAKMLSEDYYYKKYGLKTLELKGEIEQGIKDKFDETSDVLDGLDWSEGALDPPGDEVDRWLFYVMLRRAFDYETVFERLDNGSFGDAKDVKYYGFGQEAAENLRKQIEVLYYDSADDFAILINTKQGDQVIYVKNPTEQSFGEIYSGAMERAEAFHGETAVQAIDDFKAPDLALNVKRKYDELTNRRFYFTRNGQPREGNIAAAIQTIKLAMDESGGEVKSEAVIDMKDSATSIAEPTPRHFYLDDTFAVFLREKGKDTPYLGLSVDDIKKFQQ